MILYCTLQRLMLGIYRTFLETFNERFMQVQITCILSILFLFSCDSLISLERAFLSSGSNRSELEKVLHHYQDDEQKYRAAVFLIENMPGKGSILYRGKWYEQKVVEADLQVISSGFLIENIDLAFEV